MCKSTNGRRKVVISGAGPAGLLCAALLLARNNETDATVEYDVTLIDGLQDFGALSKEELAKSFRSWMLGLATHGLDAIRELPELYNNYVKGEGVELKEFNIYLGKKKFGQTADDSGNVPEAFIVDRNFIVAAIARYVKEKHENDDHFTPMYRSTCQYVDYDNQRILVRNKELKEETYVEYDLLIGCDGVRSTVREALIKRHSDFSCSITDIFNNFKAVHVDRPKSISSEGMSLLPDMFPCFQGIALPETGGKVNISCGFPRHLMDEVDEELKSDDYRIVAKYVKEKFKAFELVDYDDFAKQWVGQRWNQTGMVHCNYYHSSQMNIVIMGDAAHATSPSIGMGMNTALRDAQEFCNILKENKDDLSLTLPAFSEARVKEGNSLTSLANNLYCFNKKQQMIETIHMIARSFFHKKFPSLVANHPQNMIGVRGIMLSDVFDHATKLRIIPKHRSINEKIRIEHFEKSCGMVKPCKTGSKARLIIGAVLAALATATYTRYTAIV
jgi:kynurenine 3-monooxygenase